MTERLDQQAVVALLESMGASWPERHPYTGEPFVNGSIEQEIEHSIQDMPPPGPRPRMFEDVYDFDGEWVGEHPITKAEHARRVARWEDYCAQYREQCGKLIRQGQTTLVGKFETESGSEADGQWGGDRWLWSDVSCCAPAGEGCEDGWFEDPDKQAKGPAVTT